MRTAHDRLHRTPPPRGPAFDAVVQGIRKRRAAKCRGARARGDVACV